MAFTLYTHGVQHEENRINYKINTLSLFFVLYYLFNFWQIVFRTKEDNKSHKRRDFDSEIGSYEKIVLFSSF